MQTVLIKACVCWRFRTDCSFDHDDIQAVGRVSVFQTPVGPGSEVFQEYTGSATYWQMGNTVHFSKDASFLAVTALTQSMWALIMHMYQEMCQC